MSTSNLTHAVPATSWMSQPQIQQKHLYELLIPGTHDSATEGFSVGSLSRTQYYSINNQLKGGVRFLDMRLAYNSVEDNFHVVHGTDVTSWLNFDTVVKWCADFLHNHPGETILMSIKQEGERPGSDDAFARELGQWHNKHAKAGHWPQDLWYTKENEIPTVAQASGRIVLLRRYEVPYQDHSKYLFYGGLKLTTINSHPIGTFLIAQKPNLRPTPNPIPGVFCTFQDEYTLKEKEKKAAIRRLLRLMKQHDHYEGQNHQWFINFASSAKPDPKSAAEEINPWLEEELKALPHPIYGVLLTDYAQPALWQQIYQINF